MSHPKAVWAGHRIPSKNVGRARVPEPRQKLANGPTSSPSTPAQGLGAEGSAEPYAVYTVLSKTNPIFLQLVWVTSHLNPADPFSRPHLLPADPTDLLLPVALLTHRRIRYAGPL